MQISNIESIATMSYASATHRLIRLSISCLFVLSLLINPLLAQTDRRTKWIQAQKLFNEGRALQSTSLEQALEKLKNAQQIFHSISDDYFEGLTLQSMGDVYRALGDHHNAIDSYERALPLFTKDKQVEDRKINAAFAHYRIGEILEQSGNESEALKRFEMAATLFRERLFYEFEGEALLGIGRVQDKLGKKREAVDSLTRAISLQDSNKPRIGAKTFVMLAKVYRDLGQTQKALDSLNQALPRAKASNDRQVEIEVLGAFGTIYLDLGQEEKALARFSEALKIAQDIKDDARQAYAFMSLARAQHKMDLPQEAIESYTKAVELLRKINDRRLEAYTLNNIAALYDDLDWKPDALKYYGMALSRFREISDRQGQAMTLNNIGNAHNDLNQRQEAIRNLTDALSLYRDLGNYSGEAAVLFNLADADAAQGKLPEARINIEKALLLVESLRTSIASPESRSSYFSTVQGHYRFLIDTIMKQHAGTPGAGYEGQAFHVNERARARALLEELAEANADIRQGVDPKLLERERALQQQLSERAFDQVNLDREVRTKVAEDAIRKDIEEVTSQLQEVRAKIRQTSPKYAALTQPQPLTLKEIQTQVLDRDTVLLEYSLGPDHGYMWAVTNDSVTAYKLPGVIEIRDAARRLYRLLNARNLSAKGLSQDERQRLVSQADASIPVAAAALSRLVISPAAAQLGKKRIVVVTDDVLQFIPFAVLTDPSVDPSSPPQPLIFEHEIVNLPSASTLAVIRQEVVGRPPAPKGVAVLADPVFSKNDTRLRPGAFAKQGPAKEPPRNDETTKELELVEVFQNPGAAIQGLRIPRLPGTRKEAEQIVSMVPLTDRLLALDFAASRATATSPALSQYRYVHFSTHGFLNSTPEISGLVFSLVNETGERQDGFLRSHEVFNLKLPSEVVVLSACQTGLGKEIQGEGLMSLTRGFMYAGAPRVVVSLWSVSEGGTTELMVHFYRGMLIQGLRPAEALREAQLRLMKETRWSSPFYWAPFTLQGEWR